MRNDKKAQDLDDRIAVQLALLDIDRKVAARDYAPKPERKPETVTGESLLAQQASLLVRRMLTRSMEL